VMGRVLNLMGMPTLERI